MTQLTRILAVLVACAVLARPGVTAAQSTEIPPALTTPDKVETRIGTLGFKDGAPGDALDTRMQTNDQDVKGEKRS